MNGNKINNKYDIAARVKRIIQSCKTVKQLECADRVIELYQMKIKYEQRKNRFYRPEKDPMLIELRGVWYSMYNSLI